MNRSAVLPALGLFLLIGAAYAPTRRRGLFGLGEEGDEDEGIRVTDIPDANEDMINKIRRRQGLPPLFPEVLPAEAESAEVIDLESSKKKLTPYKYGVLITALERKAQNLPLSKAQQKLIDEAMESSRQDPFPESRSVYRAEPEEAPAPESPKGKQPKTSKKAKESDPKVVRAKPAIPAPVPVPPTERTISPEQQAAMAREAPKTPKVQEPPRAPRKAIPATVKKNDLIEVQKRRHAARKLYGTFVLSTQGADSMMRVSKRTNVEESKVIADSLYATARVALNKARELDSNYIEAQCSRPEGVPCPL
jgi:hypothetical protein